MNRGKSAAIGLGLLLLAGSPLASKSAAPSKPKKDVPMQITSAAFKEGGEIPARHTCDGEDVSPALAWSGVPAAAKSLLLIVDDPDAPGRTWTHWNIFNIPPASKGLPENFSKDPEQKEGIRQGRNDFGKIGYGGPCPPSGRHRYRFQLYALDNPLPLPPGVTRDQLLAALEGHVLARAGLLGTYGRRPS